MSENAADPNAIITQMEHLNARLKEAANAYYNEDREIMSNFEYDALYDELTALEGKYGVLLPDSITQQVGVPVASHNNVGTDDMTPQGLPKVEHETPMLSLDKTKSIDKLSHWLSSGRCNGCLSWKLDGSTVVLTYDNGKMRSAVTRGNGRIGEDITAQARKFAGVPASIPHKGKLVIRGEALMIYSEFERINSTIDDVESQYKNPRNLASGTMRSIDTSVLDERTIMFCPFTLVSVEDTTDMEKSGYDSNSYCSRLDWLDSIGFSSVEHKLVTPDELVSAVENMESRIDEQDIPSDGLVLFYDDVALGEKLGSTSHAPRNGMAFKWADETARTHLVNIAWQTSRTGRINPVAIFEPVELEGTTVERATLNNLTFLYDMLGLHPRIGQELTVYKANKIIPTIVAADDSFPSRGMETGLLTPPDTCPSCGSPTHRIDEHGSEFLMCLNDECPARNKESLVHFASRDALDIYGLSKETINRFMEAGIVASFKDILTIADKRDEIIGHIEGIGEKSFDNLVAAIEKAKKTTASRFLYSLGIREIGRSASADIAKEYDNDINKIVTDAACGNTSAFEKIDGVGAIMANEICDYMEHNENMVRELLDMVEIADAGQVAEITDNTFVNGKTFVVTGDVHIFNKRDELKAYITDNGGKLSGSVSKKTDYLITNSPDSGTSKNAKAQELGIPIITEDEFCEMAGYTK